MKKFYIIVTVLSLLFFHTFSAHADECQTAVILAIDVSASITDEEFTLEKNGTAAALRDPRVQDSILQDDIIMMLMQWDSLQWVIGGWRPLHSKADIDALANDIEQMDRRSHTATYVAEMLAFADAAFNKAPCSPIRKIIDISSDGMDNEGHSPQLEVSGPYVEPTVKKVLANGVTINGLIMINDDPDAANFYEQYVIGGPNHFMKVIHDAHEFPELMRQKLLLEIANNG